MKYNMRFDSLEALGVEYTRSILDERLKWITI